MDYAGKTGYVIDTYKLYYKDGVLINKELITTSIYKKIDKTVRTGPNSEPTDVPSSSEPVEKIPPEMPAEPQPEIPVTPQVPSVPEPTTPATPPVENIPPIPQGDISGI